MTDMIPWWRVELGEAAAQAAYDAVQKGRMTLGPLTGLLESRLAELLGVRHVVATCSGTAALTIALLEAGCGPGMEVIVPDQTWVATANAPLLLGARVLTVDTAAHSRSMDPEAFAKAISPDTRIVIPVHLNGKSPDMPKIRAIAAAHGITVIEDAAQAFMSRSGGRLLGTGPDMGCFSLAMGKMICCGQGGYVTSRDDEQAKRLRLARLHGTDDVYAGSWEMRGGNLRMWDLPAAIALTQLDSLERRMKACIELYQRYRQELRGNERLRLTEFDLESGEFPLYVECMCSERQALIEHLAAHGVQARANYQPLHTVPHFRHLPESAYPNSQRLGRECLILPSGPDRTERELETVFRALRQW
ncbi:DegT/DnrJ/EryC1/StrS family aminotransferase [Desulfovibrio sp. OttesenSCG-928-A18]|nr:DegT/DnrJ/EryC1/StrS family aminotransferase [Desulfovibrio sp. OttesenSCG-928-A18]